jgi:predicted AAA+ superfamily ATPase
LYEEHFLPRQLYPSYIQTYLERDVRMLENIGDLTEFARFTQLCAGRVGQLLHVDNLADDAGITAVVAKHWLSILEASYLIFLLQPHHRNFNKRVTKAPKLYFYDTGIACSLMRINSTETLAVHPLHGALFENMVIADLYKQYYNQAVRPPIYFWRDQNGRYEIDCVIEHDALTLVPIEIKSGQTISRDYFKGLQAWREITESPQTHGYVIYGGDATQDRSQGMVLRWRDMGTLVKRLG